MEQGSFDQDESIWRQETQRRFLFYSHDACGLGHTRRNLAVATALTKLAPDVAILMATGSNDIFQFRRPQGVAVLKLPGLCKLENESYVARGLAVSAADILELRSALLKAAVKSFRPNVLLADKHPLGVKKELRPALEALRASGGRAALGLRDILDERSTVLKEWYAHDLYDKIEHYYDRVLIYGHRNVFNPCGEYDFTKAIAERTRFCGYVLNHKEREQPAKDPSPPFPFKPRGRPVVLATAGGGEDGFTLLKAFIAAATKATWHGVVVTGPLVPENQRRTLQLLAAEVGVTFHTFVSGLDRWFDFADAIVCMGGYNTLAETVSKGAPAVCVPRISPRTEQLIRAKAFSRLGLVVCVEPKDLKPETLGQQIVVALQKSRQQLRACAKACLDFRGAERAALNLLELAKSRNASVSKKELAVT
jgi:predicted glycosyltransferase